MNSTRYLLDTNICIYLRNNKPRSVTEKFLELSPGEAGISVVNYGELAYGAAKALIATPL